MPLNKRWVILWCCVFAAAAVAQDVPPDLQKNLNVTEDEDAPPDDESRQSVDLEAPRPFERFDPSSSPLADPIVSSDAELGAQRVSRWRVGDDQYLLLDGDARFGVGLYRFTGDRVLVRLKTERRPGRLVRHLAAYIDDARPTEGGPIRAEASRMLVTASTSGRVGLEADSFRVLDEPLRFAEPIPAKGKLQLFHPDSETESLLIAARDRVRGEANPNP